VLLHYRNTDERLPGKIIGTMGSTIQEWMKVPEREKNIAVNEFFLVNGIMLSEKPIQ